MLKNESLICKFFSKIICQQPQVSTKMKLKKWGGTRGTWKHYYFIFCLFFFFDFYYFIFCHKRNGWGNYNLYFVITIALYKKDFENRHYIAIHLRMDGHKPNRCWEARHSLFFYLIKSHFALFIFQPTPLFKIERSEESTRT